MPPSSLPQLRPLEEILEGHQWHALAAVPRLKKEHSTRIEYPLTERLLSSDITQRPKICFRVQGCYQLVSSRSVE